MARILTAKQFATLEPAPTAEQIAKDSARYLVKHSWAPMWPWNTTKGQPAEGFKTRAEAKAFCEKMRAKAAAEKGPRGWRVVKVA